MGNVAAGSFLSISLEVAEVQVAGIRIIQSRLLEQAGRPTLLLMCGPIRFHGHRLYPAASAADLLRTQTIRTEPKSE